jgi:uncharacterized repeat protein (TIGR01451 family)
VGVTDPKAGAVSCPVNTLAPGASTTCTATYALTQADIDNGKVDNTATASGTSPLGATVTATDSETSPITRTASLTLDKTAGAPTGVAAGATIPYGFVVTNTGNTTLTGVGVSDPQVNAVACTPTTLLPGEQATCTATHTITQAEVNAGVVDNTATASATPPPGVTPPSATDTATVPLTRTPGISLDKQSGGVHDVDGNGQDAGDAITYTFLLQNTGNVTLDPISVTDATAGTVTCPVTSLAPGAATACHATYTLALDDVDAGHVANTATATGTPPPGLTPPEATDAVDTPVNADSSISLDKQAGAPSGAVPGSVIPYTFVVTNTGNGTLDAITIDDPLVSAVTCTDASLAPGASTTCTGSYQLTQADVDAGSVTNSATVSGDPRNGDPAVSAADSTTTDIARTPAITLDKVAGAPSGNAAGDTIAYSFVVTNSGTVTLTGVHVSDPKVGAVSCPTGTLAPGATTTCTATYALTQADVDAGHVANSAGATGTPPPGLTAPTASDVTDTPVVAAPAISLDKQAGAITDVDGNGPDAGDTIAYRFVVTNTGTVTLTGVAVSDDLVGAVTCPVATLAPGASTTCTATYALTQADVDAGHVANSAFVLGTAPGGAQVRADDSTDTPIAAAPAITLDKQAGSITDTDGNGQDTGDTIDYRFVVTNTGTVTLHAVGVDDPKTGPVTCPVAVLAPGASTTCTATYTLTLADVDAGVANNTATTAGTSPAGTVVTATDSTSTPITSRPAVLMDKQAGTPTGNTAGATVTYAFVIENTGNVTLSLLSVTDVATGAVTCPTTTLVPGQKTTCSATYTLLQADVDSGHLPNSATVTATSPTGEVISNTDSTDTAIPAAPALTLDKQAASPTGNTTGSAISYTFVVTNTGNVTLTSVGIDDPKVGTVSCPVTTIAPSATVICSATYTLTQADVDAATVDNTATASGTPPTGAVVTATDSTHTPIVAAPALTLDKTAGTLTGNSVGDTIDYTFLIVNTGNVTLYDGGLHDPKVGPVSCPVSFLAPGGSTTCTATYTLTQEDVDAGHVANTATATALPPTGDPVLVSDSTDTPIPSDPGLTLDKQAGIPTGNFAGDTIDYSFVVTNSGNVTLTAVTVSDPKVGAVSCPVTELAPGASTTCTATYRLTQADVDAAVVDNTATATGTPPTGAAVTATDTVSTPIPGAPALTLDKQAGAPSGNTAGSTIAYAFVVENTGNITLFAGGIDDPKVGAVSCPVSSLAPGSVTTCTATYTITQADVDAGHVANSATAWGTSSGGPISATDTTDTPIVSGPAITLVKTAGAPSGNRAGDAIDYTFLVTNSGNVTLSAIAVSDPLVGAVACPVADLAPRAATTCTATYLLTQADVDAGVVDNTATASGTPPTGAAVSATDSATATISSDPAITLVKTAGTPSGNTEGDTIGYTFGVTNTGNVTLDTVGVSDPKVGTVDCPDTTLAPGDSTTCTATYSLTQADVDAGHVANTATASGTPPTGPAVTATDDTDTTIPADPAITLDKQAGTPSGNTEGDTIAYTFGVTNTGNVTLDTVGISDPKVGTVDCPDTTLAPGDSTTCTATYSLTQADVDAGHVANTANASGTSPLGAVVTATDATDTTIPAGAAITLDKLAGTPSADIEGGTIDYTFLVTNTGNVTLHGVAVADPLVGTVDCPDTTLAPHASTTCTATYVLTQADVDAGAVDNSATASGLPPSGADPVTATDGTHTPITAAPAIDLLKQAGPPSGNNAGDTIDYTFEVTNTGNVTLSPVNVTDPLVGAVSCPVVSLAPGAAATCTGTYRLAQADVDAGTVDNTATAFGNPPAGNPATTTDDVQSSSSVSTPIVAAPGIDLVKTGTAHGDRAGSPVDYTFEITNTGNVTLHAVSVSDPKVGTVSCPVTTLAPGASTTCTGTYEMAQADVDAGVVHNDATATGTSPTGVDVTAPDSVDVPIVPGPYIGLDKRLGAVNDLDHNGVDAGDTVDYTFEVTNTGNVSLTSVILTDPLATPTCPKDTLAVDEVMTCTATYTLTTDDLDTGELVNNASVSGLPPTGDPVTDTDTVTVPLEQVPSIGLTKSADITAELQAGDRVTYTLVVLNTGNVTLTDVEVSDPLLGAVTCPQTTLAAGESMTCTAAPYIVTRADVKRGHVLNNATADGSFCPVTGCLVLDASDNAVVDTGDVKDDGDLAYTGFSAGPVLLYGGATLAAGLLLLIVGRRRRT